MSYRIEITEQARTDLMDIYSYIAYQLLEPTIAKKQYGRIKKGVLSLDKFPERNPLYKDEPWRSRGLRTQVVDNFLAFYLVNNEAQTVTVLRVMYGGRDMGAILD